MFVLAMCTLASLFRITCAMSFHRLHAHTYTRALYHVKNDFKNDQGIFLECGDRVIGATGYAAVKEFRCCCTVRVCDARG